MVICEGCRQDYEGIKRPYCNKCLILIEEALKANKLTRADAINPSHYKNHPSGFECIEITFSMSFTFGNAIKYLWRYNQKNFGEDLKKCIWYLRYTIRIEGTTNAGIISDNVRFRIANCYPEFIKAAFKLLLLNQVDEVDMLKAIELIKKEIFRITGEKYNG